LLIADSFSARPLASALFRLLESDAMSAAYDNPDALPQPIGEYRPFDEWQAHVNAIFYGLRGHRCHELYQTFASADYRLGHALAADYYDRVTKRDRDAPCGTRDANPSSSHPSPVTRHSSPLVVVELGPGNGNLAACFLSHLKRLDTDTRVYPRVRYLLVDPQASALETAKAHPDLKEHLSQVETLVAAADHLAGIEDGTVDRIICSELWNELPTKLMLRKGGDLEEEFVRPNLNEKRQAGIADWPGFVKAFDAKDVAALQTFAFALEDIVWEREYQQVDWKAVPYRKSITEFLKRIDEQVLVPVNLGALAAVKEAKRVLSPQGIGLSGFDAGTSEMKVLNDPEKPCYGQHGGQFSFLVNFALMETVARHLGLSAVTVEPQREFVGRCLDTNVLSLMDVLATHPSIPSLKPWEQERLVLETIRALNEVYRSPYARTLDFPLGKDMPQEERDRLQGLMSGFPAQGVPDTVAYIAEPELRQALGALGRLGYEEEVLMGALRALPTQVEYVHFTCRLN
jgi:hypothetical protein